MARGIRSRRLDHSLPPAALIIHGQDFIDGFILKHNVKRFTGTLEGHAGSLFYYVIAVPLLLLPWTGPLIATLRGLRTDIKTATRRFLWLWAGFVVVFFSLSGTKLPHYALYGATPLFMLVAAHREEFKRMWVHAIAPTALLALFPLLPLVFAALAETSAGNAFYRAQLERSLEAATAGYYLVTVLGLLIWAGVLWRVQASVWRKMIGAALIQLVVLVLAVVPFVGEVLQGPVKNAGLRAQALGDPAVRMRFDAPSFSVYREAATPAREAQPGELAITRIDRVPETGYDTVFAQGGVRLLRRQAQ